MAWNNALLTEPLPKPGERPLISIVVDNENQPFKQSEKPRLRVIYPRSRDLPGAALDKELQQILLYLFTRLSDGAEQGALETQFFVAADIMVSRLEKLAGLGLVCCKGTNFSDGLTYWDLTPQGRKYVIAMNLCCKMDWMQSFCF